MVYMIIFVSSSDYFLLMLVLARSCSGVIAIFLTPKFHYIWVCGLEQASLPYHFHLTLLHTERSKKYLVDFTETESQQLSSPNIGETS